jgi:uncharacterized protein
MHIEDLSKKASLDFLAGRRFGRIACTNLSQPYVTPFHFAYHDPWIYSFGTVGRKIEWLRANPLACVEADDIKDSQNWISVIVFGRFEELTASGDHHATRDFAHSLLQQHQIWWEPGYARTLLLGAPRTMEPVYFRLSIDEITGHRAVPD